MHHIYICSINFNINNLKIQEEEVAEIKTIPLNELIAAIKSKKNNFVPHGTDYYSFVFDKIKKY